MTKEKVKKEELDKKETTEELKYFYGVGKRKTSVAQVRLYPEGKSKEVLINDRKLADYFGIERLAEKVKEPFSVLGENGGIQATIRVVGGGVNSQAEAAQLGIARALVLFDEALRKPLRAKELLTRDSRIVERKKAGLKKARRSPQWAKR